MSVQRKLHPVVRKVAPGRGRERRGAILDADALGVRQMDAVDAGIESALLARRKIETIVLGVQEGACFLGIPALENAQSFEQRRRELGHRLRSRRAVIVSCGKWPIGE